MSNLKSWIKACRPKTLPLALSSIILGSFIAAADSNFSWTIFILITITALLLQILSNLANDYGDYKTGADDIDRIGPERMTQSGNISPLQMRTAIILMVILIIIMGSFLIFFGTPGENPLIKILFYILGLGAIATALKYTIGKKPFAYQGLGDIFVFIFFGFVGLIGTYYFHTHEIKADLFLPAASIGFLCASVLNVNNMRDYEADKKANKRTIVVKMGERKARYYHLFLLSASIFCGILYTIINFRSGYQLLFLISMPLIFFNIKTIFTYKEPIELYSELMKLSLSTLLFSFSFGLGLIL